MKIKTRLKKVKIKYLILSLVLLLGFLGYLINLNINKGYCTSESINYDGYNADYTTLTITGTADGSNVAELNISTLKSKMNEHSDTLKTVKLTGSIKLPSDCSLMFLGYSNLTAISFGYCVDTSNVTDMSYMFCGCRSLESLYLCNFDTSNVTSMMYMFSNCQALIELDISDFNTSNVTSMYNMFTGCTSLISLDVSGFNTSLVSDMMSMFYGCSSLESLDLSSFTINDGIYTCHKLTSGGTLYNLNFAYNMNNLTTIYLGNNITTFGKGFFDDDGSDYTPLSFFYVDSAEKVKTNIVLPSGASDTLYNLVKNYDWASDNRLVRIYKGPDLKYSEWTDSDGDVYNEESLNIVVSDVTDGKKITVTGTKDSFGKIPKISWTKLEELKTKISDNKATLKEVEFIGHIKCPKCTSLYDLFDGCTALENVTFGEYFDTKNVINMCCMFYDCNSLENLDLSNLDTSNVTTMKGMFYNCNLLTSLNASNFDTNNVTNMLAMFEQCSSLTSLNVSSFDTSNVTDMSGMFYDCSSLTSLDVSNFDTSEVEYMTSMFDNCSSLTNVDVSNFDTSNVTDISTMFYNCSSLTSLDLSNFDTSNVTIMEEMFYECSSLSTLDLSSFTITSDNYTCSQGTYNSVFYNDIFAYDMSNLTTIYFGNNITSFGKGYDYDNSTDYVASNFFYVNSAEKVKTKLMLPSNATDALYNLVKDYDWEGDKRLIRIYKGTELVYSEWDDPIIESDDDDDSNKSSKGSSSETKSSTITVSSGSSGDVLNQSLNNTGYIKGYTSSSLFGTSTKKFKPNENITRAEIATIFTRIDSNYNANKDYSSSSLKYSDITSNKWYSSAVGFVTERNIMKGYGETFKADGYITRAELCSAICNYKNINLTSALSYSGNLSDIDNKWYTNYVKTLSKLGYINGYKDGTFKGDNPVTRAEACKIINKMLGIDNTKVVKENEYSDIKNTDWYYIDVVNASME